MKKANYRRIISFALSALMVTGVPFIAFADAGEAPPPITTNERVFPDPDSFSYDDVEVNFAKGLQYSLYFYDANKCGEGIAGGNLEWRGDCHTEDYHIPLINATLESADTKIGTNMSEEFIEKYRDVLDPDGDNCVDCGGGMHDAGDHVKFGLPGSYAASTVGWGYYEFRDAYIKSGNQEHIEDILHWFNDFYLKGTYFDENGEVIAFCYQVGEGNNDHNYWCPPELQSSELLLDFARPAYFATEETPASDMCAGAAASLAISYLNFKDTEPEYAEKCFKAAKGLYDFAVKTRSEDGVQSLGYDGGFYDSSYDHDEMSWAAVWLYECTKDYEYINDIISVDTENPIEATGTYPYTGYMKRIITDTGRCWQNIWVHCWDTVWGGVFAKLAPVTNTARDWYIFRWNLEFWSGITHAFPGGLDDQLWNMEYKYSELTKTSDNSAIRKTPAGFSMLNEYGSARYNTAAQLCALVYRKETAARGEEDARFADWAKSQMEYIMGKNPMNRPYIVGWSETAASHPHHRAAHGSSTFNMDDPAVQTHVLWGALVGGPDSSDWHRDITKDYVYNEVAVDYNAGFVGSCAGLYYYYGTEDMKPQENFPPLEPPKKNFYLEAYINQENVERTQCSIRIHNDFSNPPQFLDEFKVRYYFDITELLKFNQTIKDVRSEVYYDQAVSMSDGKEAVTVSQPIHQEGNIYYIEMDWKGAPFRGTREIQIGLVVGQDENFKSNWDPTNDYSRQGLSKEEVYKDTKNIPLYYQDELVYGVPYGETTVKYGDVNGDGLIDNLDLVSFCQHLIKDKSIDSKFIKNADINKDEVIDIADIAILKQYIMGDKTIIN